MTRMNGSGEIHKEATDRIMKVLGTKTKTRIGFWNVRVCIKRENWLKLQLK